MIHIRPNVPKAPITRPGKRPAAKERPLKPCSVGWMAGGAFAAWVWAAGGALVGDDVGNSRELVDEGVAVSAEHMPLWHLYPRGQHEDPHVGSVISLVSEKWTWLSGCRVALYWLTSQLIGWMKEQSSPLGQHMAAMMPVLLIGMQDVAVGQQKSSGKPVPHCSRLEIPPQVPAPWVVMFWASIVDTKMRSNMHGS